MQQILVRVMKKYLLWALTALVLVSCKNGGRLLTSTNGSVYECLVVCEANIRNAVKDTLAEYMYGLPQNEHTMTVSCVSKDQFDGYLQATRNILQIDIDRRQYTKVKVATAEDVWAKPQAYVRIQAPSKQAFMEYWEENGAAVREWFVREELARHMRFYQVENNEAAQRVLKRWKYKMYMPEDYLMIMDTTIIVDKRKTQVLWCCNNKGSMRKDFMIYTYPYTSQDQFSNDSIVAMRDKVMGRLVSAQIEGSYMKTEWKHIPPVSRSVTPLKDTTGGFYAVETRGLWKIQDGEAMGGPFVSLTRLDQVNAWVVHAEAFLYAPNEKKRSAIRQMESLLYSLKMPNER